jgi:hypothetical protein
MSIESMSLALNLVDDRLTPTDKLLLVGIANHDGDGGAWPSVATLARYCGISVRGVQKRLSYVEGLGYISRELGAGGSPKTPVHERPSLYHLHLRTPPVPQDTPPPVPQDTRTVPEPSREPSNPLSAVADEFPLWWQAYLQTERPGSKGDALRQWNRMSKSHKGQALVAIHRHLDYIGFYPGRFVMPNGATWLSKMRWEDEMPQEPPRQNGGHHTGIEALRKMQQARNSS